jgi:glycosyltransferase involved in cell wall biosynthesis
MWWGAEFRALPKMRDGSRKLLELHSSYGVREYENRAGRMQWIRRIRWTLTKWAESRVVGQYDRLVVLTHEDAAHWRHRNLTVIPNSLSFVVDAASDQSRPVVVSVGRLTASKGFDRLLRAWAVIAEEYPTWQLRIFGSGEERENILHQIERFQLTNVMLSPPTPDIQEELLQASVFAFASRCEGFGMVLIEAMQCGLPAVAYRVPCGPSEIIGDGVSGYLVDDDDEAGFVAALRRLIANPELRRKMGLAAKRLSEDKFREDLIMARWQAVFEEMSVTCTD